VSAPIFPDEPIRVSGDPMLSGAYFPVDDDPVDDNYEERACMSCEDGLTWCDGDDLMCPEADDSGCYMHHCYRCTNCGGSGLAKDQRFW
jgi:hypothetical protein